MRSLALVFAYGRNEHAASTPVRSVRVTVLLKTDATFGTAKGSQVVFPW